MTSFLGGNPDAEKLYLRGKLQIDFIPQGSLAERIRCAQSGIHAFFTPAGVGGIVEFGGFPYQLSEDGTPLHLSKGREKRVFDGKEYLMEEAFEADYSLVKALVGDKYGNLRYRKASRNFCPAIAGAARITVAEVDHIVDHLPPEKIHTPGCLVDRIFQGDYNSRKIERLKVRYESQYNPGNESKAERPRNKICRRLAKELKTGMYVNLGIGIPSEVPPYLSSDVHVNFQMENGLVGGGPYPLLDNIDPDIINAGKETITAIPGYSISDSTEAFGMMRGKHLHMTMLGGMQVSTDGDLANWVIPGKKATGMGGAMDLATSSTNVIVAMEHINGGQPRILNKCTYPLTAKQCVKKVVTNLAVFEIRNRTMVLVEKDPSISLEELKKITPADYTVDPNLKDYQV